MFNLQDEIQDFVDHKVSESDIFTAYDITLVLREDFPDEDVPHSTVKAQVHQSYQDGYMPGYTRERASDIAGMPWRYLPPETDDSVDSD